MRKWLAAIGTATLIGLTTPTFGQTDIKTTFTKNAVAECFLNSKGASPIERIDNESDCLGLATEYVLQKTSSSNYNQMLLLRSSFLDWANVGSSVTQKNESILFQEAKEHIVNVFWREDYKFQVELINAYIAWYKAKRDK